MLHLCSVCGKRLPTPSKLTRHLKTHSNGQHGATTDLFCPHSDCNMPLQSSRAMARHLREQHQQSATVQCEICGKEFTRRYRLTDHITQAHGSLQAAKRKCAETLDGSPSGTKRSRCDSGLHTSDSIVANKEDSRIPYTHREGQQTYTEPTTTETAELPTERELVETSGTETSPGELCFPESGTETSPMESTNKDCLPETGVNTLINRNWKYIKDWQKINRKIKDSYNVRMDSYNFDLIEDRIRTIFGSQKNAFKTGNRSIQDSFQIDVSLGAILERRPKEGEGAAFRYFYPSANTSVLPKPASVANIHDLKNLLEVIRNADIEAIILQDRPDTGYKLKHITNVRIDIYKQKQHAIGDTSQEITISDIEIAEFVMRSGSARSFTRVHNRPVRDKLCAFRCLAYHKTKNPSSERLTRQLFRQWAAHMDHNLDPQEFDGITMSDLPSFEKLFRVNVRVYTLVRNNRMEAVEEGEADDESEATDDFSVKCLRASDEKFTDTMTLNLNFNHFSYITDIESFCKSWRCHRCDRFFSHRRNYQRHLDNDACDGDTRLKYAGGGFGLKPTVFEDLERQGISVETERRFFPFRAAYDFECRFEDLPPDEHAKKLKFNSRLIPASVSIAANVPGYESPCCFLNEDPDSLVGLFLGYVDEISAASYEILSDSYSDVLEKLENRLVRLSDLRQREKSAGDGELEVIQGLIKTEERIEKTNYRFQNWIKQLPVLGFNSGKFDLNLIKRYLIPHLLETTDAKKIKPIKRGHTFMSVALENVNFLDISNYLGAGTSYEKWIKAFGVEQRKGIWPYEWFKTFDQLDQTSLPSQGAFDSKLKQKKLSDEDYQMAQQIWEEQGFRTMRDMLIWYNNLDVSPFLVAAERMFNEFKKMSLDMFKQGAISLPGLAMLHLFDGLEVEDFFQLFDENSKNWHELIRQNVVGGPSIIFNRLHAAKLTKIRNGENDCTSVQGFDANQLYNYCTGYLPMPVGLSCEYQPIDDAGCEIPTSPTEATPEEIERTVNDNLLTRFRRRKSPGETELAYVMWTFHQLQKDNPGLRLTLRHRYSGEGQMAFYKGKKPIPVDGYIPELNTIINFHGCHWHGHTCQMGLMDEETRLEKQEGTAKIRNFLRGTGAKLIEGYECAFKIEARGNFELEQYLQKLQPWGPYQTTAAGILGDVLNGKMFGVVECDIQVPWWVDGMREKFQEMTPIFKNTLISRDDIGPTMNAYAQETRTMTQPRRSLIGSYFGTKILLTTPLLKWYLRHGLVVTRVHQALQFREKRVFEHLTEEVSKHRAEADKNPDKKVVAELYKLLGNSYYGKCLTNKLKQNQVSYVGEEEASRAINETRFKGATEITADVFEVSMKKKQIIFDLPILVAFFVYSGAKLRMLEFFYDFLDVVLERDQYEMVEMDTDSLYFACSHNTLEEAIRPHKRELYDELKGQFLALNDDPFSPGYDQRIPGLFKTEWVGAGMCALNSKTYIGFDDKGAVSKKSTKGLNKASNDITLGDFRHVLETTEPVSGTNYGFRLHDGCLVQYEQEKAGLTYFYPKRVVLVDGRSTMPLEI